MGSCEWPTSSGPLEGSPALLHEALLRSGDAPQEMCVQLRYAAWGAEARPWSGVFGILGTQAHSYIPQTKIKEQQGNRRK